jgi:hypothetical protein
MPVFPQSEYAATYAPRGVNGTIYPFAFPGGIIRVVLEPDVSLLFYSKRPDQEFPEEVFA